MNKGDEQNKMYNKRIYEYICYSLTLFYKMALNYELLT